MLYRFNITHPISSFGLITVTYLLAVRYIPTLIHIIPHRYNKQHDIKPLNHSITQVIASCSFDHTVQVFEEVASIEARPAKGGCQSVMVYGHKTVLLYVCIWSVEDLDMVC